MARNRTAHRGFILGGVALALVGCGGGGNESATSDTSPLVAIFGGSESPAQLRADQLKQEQLTADCMSEFGWEYIPVDYEAQFGGSADDEDAGLSAQEYGEKYAYGVVHSYELYELPGILAQSGDGTADTVPGEGFVDPNADYVSSLSGEEQEQYYADLYGEQTYEEPIDDGSDTTVFVMPTWEEQGCAGKASHEVNGESPWENPDFQQRFSELSEDLSNDPTVKAAQREWKTCLEDKAPDAEANTPDEIWTYFDARKAELAGQELIETEFDPNTGEPTDPSIDTSDLYSSSSREDGSGYVVIGQPEALTEEEIEQLRTEEREVYDADQACQKKVGLIDAQQKAEQKLANAILEEFPQYKDQTSGEG